MDTELVKTQDKYWSVSEPLPATAKESLIAYPPIVRQLLFNRDVINNGQADLYLNPGEHLLGDFRLMPDIELATERIAKAIDTGEKIAIYGDFDSDGITATALVHEALAMLGADIIHYIPNRIKEGHGLNERALNLLVKENVDLVVTVDCGVDGLQQSEDYPQSLDIIVTDHHIPGKVLPPVFAVVNPMREDSVYPFPELAGVGVALKLVQSIYKKYNKTWDASLLELVAVGTVADVAPLVGENRYLVNLGLNLLKKTKRPGLLALGRRMGVNFSNLNEETIGFVIAPHINAAGRLGDPEIGFNLLITKEKSEALRITESLYILNKERQKLTSDIYKRSEEMWSQSRESNEKIIIVGAADFSVGISGLAASRLVEKYYLPSIVYQEINGEIRASARSIPEVDITSLLAKCSDLLTKFGGHNQAAGFIAPIANLDSIKSRLQTIIEEVADGWRTKPAISIDSQVFPSELTGSVNKFIDLMAPYGAHNAAPVFIAKDLLVVSKRMIGVDSAHLKFVLQEKNSGNYWSAVGFRMGIKFDSISESIDIVYKFKKTQYKVDSRAHPGFELEILDFRSA